MLLRSEREELILQDRAAERAAINLEVSAAEVGFVGTGDSFDRRISHGVESWITPAGNAAAVKRICSGLHVQDDDAAGAVAILRVDRIFLKRYFLHRVHSGRVGTLVARSETHAIKQNVVRSNGAAAGVEVARVGVVIRPVFV